MVSSTMVAPTVFPSLFIRHSLNSAQCLAVGFCFCSCQLLHAAFLVTIMLCTSLQLSENIISSNNAVDSFFDSHVWVYLGSLVYPASGSWPFKQYQLQASSHGIFWATIVPPLEHHILQSGCFIVWWLCSYSLTTGNLAWLQKVANLGTYPPLLGVFQRITFVNSWKFPLY